MRFWMFTFFVGLIITIIQLVSVKSENKSLKKTIRNLEEAVRDLYDKTYYNYDQIKDLNSTVFDQNTEKTPAAVPQTETSISDKPPVTQTQTEADISDKPPVTVSQNEVKISDRQLGALPHIYDNTPQSNVFAGNSDDDLQQDTVSPYQSSRSESKENYAAASLTETSDTENAPSPIFSGSPYPAAPLPPVHTKKSDGTKHLKSFENWLGTRLFNVVASLMIFIGLVLFCMLGYEYITDTMKMAAMFVVSGSFISLGAFFTKKNKSVFSLGLTGCGFGAFFISTLLSHVYFHALNDISAFGLLLFWSAAALVLSKKLNSVTLSVTAHMGTAVSICFAFSYGFSAERIVLPIVYQLCAIAVIIIGNIFCCKKTYRFGLFMSIILLVYTSIVMCSAFSSRSVIPGTLTPSFTVMIFAVQYSAISFVSYLITISTAALDKEILLNNNNNNFDLVLLAHILNKLLWTAGTISSVGVISGIILRNALGLKSLVVPTLAVCAAELGHIIVTLIMSEKLNFNEKLARLSIWFNSVIIMTALFVQSTTRDSLKGVPFLFIYSLFIMLVIYITKNKRLNHLAAFLIGCEMVYMSFYGYTAVSNVVISILYMLAVGIVALLHWFMQSDSSRERRFTLIKLTEYLWISVSIIPINVSEFSDISLPLILSEFALMNIIVYFCKYCRDNELGLKITVRIESLLTVYAGCIALMFNSTGSLGETVIIKIVFILLLAGLTSIYIKEFAVSNKTVLQVLAAATLSGFVTAFFLGFANDNKLAELYVYVLKCIPFFFITAVSLSVIYYVNRNHNLRTIIWASLGTDAALMMFFGYYRLLDKFSYDKVLFAIAVIICIAHAVIDGLMLYYTWELKEKHLRKDSLTIVKSAEYFWINFSAASVCISIISETSNIPNDLILVVLALINVIIWLTNYCGKNNSLKVIINLCSNILLYICIAAMSVKIYSTEAAPDGTYIFKYAVRFALILLSLGLYYLISRRIIKIKSVLIQAYIGFTATLIVNAACRGLFSIFTIQYIFSIVTMITALICIAAGFAANTKGLRVYGLIVVMLCVIKLVTVDIGTADSLSRVAAFVVGGIVCFIISGIYNKVESKLINNEDNQINQAIENVNVYTESSNEQQ